MFLSFVVMSPMVDDVALFFEVLVICSKYNIFENMLCEYYNHNRPVSRALCSCSTNRFNLF
jgi:hypothetical protein